MVDLFKWCLSHTYFAGRITGVLNFEIDLKTGRAKVTRKATICAACSNLVVYIMLACYVINVQRVVTVWAMTNRLQEYILVALSVFRIICVSLSLVSRWCNRREFVQLIDSFSRQFGPEILPYCRRRIYCKIFSTTAVNLIQFIIILIARWKLKDLSTTLSILGLFSITVVISMIIMQYFIAMANIRARYILLNRELKAIVSETQNLNPKQVGVFVTSCCNLADRLEKVAKAQSDLQAFIDRLTTVFEVEVVCLIVTYFANLVVNLYLLLSINEFNIISNISLDFLTCIFTALNVFYFVDFWVNASNIFSLLDAHEEMVVQLSQRTSFQVLDPRLETVIDSFNLNLARNPFKLRFLGLFKIDRFALFALINSILGHTIVLVQIEFENK
ncbi:putative gustatory receptor 59d [Drosophila biarmipes]|uniref:putative gustatory receptor 59d n=1 Tax=Drosophila biarmipes TaxID=125945 RepID=UPI0021CC5AB6|nr:putative gustatory receptor 59d [Drosophila biarmipes]